MRNINHLYDHTDQKEIDICHSAILPIASFYGDTISAYFADMERRGTDSRVMDVQDMSRAAAELLVAAGIEPDDANISYIVRGAVQLTAKRQKLDYETESFLAEDGNYHIRLKKRPAEPDDKPESKPE